MSEIVFNLLLILLIAVVLFLVLSIILLMLTKENPDEEHSINRYEQIMERYKDK